MRGVGALVAWPGRRGGARGGLRYSQKLMSRLLQWSRGQTIGVARVTLAVLVIAACVAHVFAATAPAPPHLLVPVHPDSVSIESEPAPLIVPGRTTTPDSLVRTPQKFAREQAAMGRQLEAMGNPGGAMLAYRNAARADTLLPGVSGKLGSMYLGLGHASAAEPLLRRELRHTPGDTEASRNLGLVLSSLGRHAEAIARIKRLTVKEPGNDEHWYALGVAYANAGKLREAEAPLKRAIALSPDRPLEHRDLGVVYGSLKDRKSTRLNSSHVVTSRMPSSA